MSGIDHAPVLHHGSSGEWVKYLQQLLTAADTSMQRWPTPVDGHFGTPTDHAVRAFQAWVPLHVTGTVDAETWAALYRNAQGSEQTDEVIGQLAGDERAGHHGHKLPAGEQAGHSGWQHVNLQCTVHDFNNEVLNALAYVRFVSAADQAESDEEGRIDDGTLILNNVWVPVEGTMTVYISVVQGTLTHVSGVIAYRIDHGQHMSFEIKQDSEVKTVTVSQSDENGWTYGGKVSAGADFKVLSIGGEFSTDHHTATTHEAGEEVHVRLPLPSLTLIRNA